MSRLAFLATVLTWGAVMAPAQDARVQIAGTVRSATSGEAISGAAVTLLASNGKGRISGRTSTDLHGIFTLSGLEPGQYQVTIGKAGYQGVQIKAPVSIARRDSAVPDLVVSLWPNSAISGRVMNWEGRTVADSEVLAFAIVYESTGVALSLAAKGRINEIGQYRLPDLPAGKYLLQVSPSRTPNPEKPSYPDVPVTYYPGTVLPSQALLVELHSGADFASADVRIPPDPTYTIAGVVWDVDAEAPCTHCTVQLTQHDAAYRVSFLQPARVASDGAFLLHGLASGDYGLVASRGSTRMTHTEVSIRDRDVEDVRLTLGAQYSLSGEVVLEDPPAGIDVTGWSVHLSPLNLPVGWPQEQADVAADRQFAIPEVPPARYRFELRGLPPGAYLKALQGGQLLPNSELEVSPNTALRLQPIVRFDAASLSGKVRSSENWASDGAQIFVLPQAGQTAQSPISAETATDGSFSVLSLAPGSYIVYALPTATSLQIFDPAVQGSLSGYAKQVNLDPKETMNVEIPLASPLP